MLVIEVRLLTGRYGAARYNDRGSAEWPPHPGRLFSAMVSTWADAEEPSPEEHADLEWLERQEPPHITCSDRDAVVKRTPVTVFVPGNDPTVLTGIGRHVTAWEAARERLGVDPSDVNRRALDRAEAAYRQAVVRAGSADGKTPPDALELLPELRNRQARQFPVVIPDDPVVTFIWPNAEADQSRREHLDNLLSRVARIGHSSTHVSCRVVDTVPEAVTYSPRRGGGKTLRVPRPGLLARLEQEFARHQGIRERRLPSGFAEYGEAKVATQPPPSGIMAGDVVVLRITSPRIGLTRSLELARALQEALAEHRPATEYVTGDFSDGSRRPHVAVVALADVGHQWATGHVRGLALVFPTDVASVDRTNVGSAVAAWRVANGDPEQEASGTLALADGTRVTFDEPRALSGSNAISRALVDDLPYALRPWVWREPAKAWVSVTPVALDRHVSDPYRASATAEIVARACVHAGLPEPVDVVVAPVPALPMVPRASGRDHRRAFPPYVGKKSGVARQSVHATLTFAEEVAGPVLIGAGRYLGRGLFLPLTRSPQR